ncbi:hypothetical protein LGF53_000202 [Salmonella enterica]|nr:hypothetical protein [Salmonella enterica]EIG9419954.1 hypothetical protein [Salmonella enterica]EIL3511201.1 hypothetical protein [Salmonella enterica]EIL3702303.1 hypothetical protein [Salmonella enterica]EIT6132259.1 hypothetical protein [Salmonella enterica]
MSDEHDFNQQMNELRKSVLNQLKSTLNQQRQIPQIEVKEPPSPEALRADEVDSSNIGGSILSFSQPALQVSSLDPERQRLNNEDFQAEIDLKKTYGKSFLCILAVQLLIMNMVFVADGFQWVFIDDTTLRIYMAGTLTEVFGLVLVVTKYLFKRR